MQPKKITNQNDFIDLVEKYTFLTNEQLSIAEDLLANGDYMMLTQLMPKLTSIVNNIGYLRGQGGGFMSILEQGLYSGLNKDLYVNERACEQRLESLIEKIIANPSSKKTYYIFMKEYYFDTRGLKDFKTIQAQLEEEEVL